MQCTSTKKHIKNIHTHAYIRLVTRSSLAARQSLSTSVIVYFSECVCVCARMCPFVIWWVNISGSGAVCWWKECKNREITATPQQKSWRRNAGGWGGGVRTGWPWAPILPSSRRFVHLSLSLSLCISLSLHGWLADSFGLPQQNGVC